MPGNSSLTPSDEARIEKAVSVLSRDGLVVYPTETVYGLGYRFSLNTIPHI